MISDVIHFKLKCACCGRHLDEVKTAGSVSILRKCKSCKNNITTVIEDGKIIKNAIDTKSNAFDILNHKNIGSRGANQRK